MIRINAVFDKHYLRIGAACSLAAACGLLLLLLAACGGEATSDPLASYVPAMRPAFQAQVNTLTQLPRYDITVTLDVVSATLIGQQEVHVVNSSPDPWPTLVFRLYPMLTQYSGGLQNVMVIHRAAINGKTINVS